LARFNPQLSLMGNRQGAEAIESDEEYVVCNVSKIDMDSVRELISSDSLEKLQAVLPEIKTVDTDSYLEFSDALVCINEDEEVYTLPGKFDAPDPNKDKLEQLIDTGYVMTMIEFAEKQESKQILAWLNSMVETEKLEQAAAKLGDIPDFNALSLDFPGTSVDSCFIEETNCYEMLREEGMINTLLKGGIKFWYDASTQLSMQTKSLVRAMVNLSDFDDEEAENNVPVINVDDPEQVKKYTYIATKACVFAPTKHMNLINIDLLVNPDYQQHVQSWGSDRIHIMRAGEDGWQPKNDRTIRAVTHVVGSFNITLQNQCSICPIDIVNNDPALNHGLQWDFAYLAERTKQNVKRRDSTVKFKSLTLLKQYDNACLMMIFTLTVNSLVPAWMVKMGKAPLLKTCTNIAKGNRDFFATYPGGLPELLEKLKKNEDA